MTAFPTLRQFRSANAISRRFVRAACDERREDALRFFYAASNLIDTGLDSGVSRSFLADMAKGLHDEITNLDTGIRRDLDNAGIINEWRPIDLEDLNLLIESLS